MRSPPLLIGIAAAFVLATGVNTATPSPPELSGGQNTTQIAAADPADKDPADVPTPKVREFTFHYRFAVKGLQRSPDKERNTIRVWVPRPPSNAYQEVTALPATAPGTFS